MIRVLIISAEPRLVNVVKEIVGDADYSVVDRWSTGQTTLFQGNHQLALIDYECLKAEQIDAFAAVDTVFKEVAGVILVRYEDARTLELKAALPSLHQMVDMSQGKAAFQQALLNIVQEVSAANTLAIDNSVEATQREARRERDRLDESERKKTKAYRATEDSAALERELHHLWMQMKNVESKYEVFGLWKGCGRRALQERFYLMVMEHHPDAYGGNVSERVKNSAQDIFIHIKDTYQELLKVEKEQTVAPKAETSPNPFLRRATTSTRVVPVKQTPSRQPQPTPVIAIQNNAEASEPIPQEEQEMSREDVKARIERLSGFRKREQQRMRRRSRPGLSIDSDLIDDSIVEESEIEESEPEIDLEAERREKLMALQRKASKVNHPNLSNPAKESFNDGYRAFREESYVEALKHFEQAYKLIPEDGMYQTYYAYVLFKLHPEKHEEVEEILKNAMNSGHKQALPDALLFMGHLLKSRGELDKAHKHYERALKLNPACTEAERELRLAKLRNERKSSEPGSFIKNLFKK